MSIAVPVIVIAALIGSATTALVLARRRYEPATDTLLDEVNRLLPQTQCAQCGYPGCRPYAEAIVTGEAINRCPPGGSSTISALAELLGQPEIPLNEDCGTTTEPQVAVIREEECIGCTLCIQACPVDAIVGAPQLMHTVIADACTGCDLCRPPCPVDCIDLEPAAHPPTERAFPSFAMPCINCGECSDACPRDLQPQLLHWFREDIERGQSLKLDACIECRRCDNVCPSEIPLTETFQVMKFQARRAEAEKAAAKIAEQRFEIRETRLIASTSKVKARPSSTDREKLLSALKGDS